jgi:hypothetical protein
LFFDPFASAAGTASAPGRYILIEQLLTSAGDSVRIQTGEQPTLLLVEQAVEKQYGGPEFIGRHLENGSIDHRRNRPRGLPGAELIPSVPTIGGGVQEASGHLKSAQTSCAHQIAEGILDFGMERVSQFVGEPATRGLIGEGFDGGNQSAVAGKPNCITGPQACVVEAGGFAEGIVAAAMGIAGQVIYDSQ